MTLTKDFSVTLLVVFEYTTFPNFTNFVTNSRPEYLGDLLKKKCNV